MILQGSVSKLHRKLISIPFKNINKILKKYLSLRITFPHCKNCLQHNKIKDDDNNDNSDNNNNNSGNNNTTK